MRQHASMLSQLLSLFFQLNESCSQPRHRFDLSGNWFRGARVYDRCVVTIDIGHGSSMRCQESSIGRGGHIMELCPFVCGRTLVLLVAWQRPRLQSRSLLFGCGRTLALLVAWQRPRLQSRNRLFVCGRTLGLLVAHQSHRRQKQSWPTVL